MNSLTESIWLAPFGLNDRVGTPDLVLAKEPALGLPHGAAMRAAFDNGVEGFLSIGSLPTIAFVSGELDRTAIDRLHQILWNQGLASLLVVTAQSRVQIYTLWQRPVKPGSSIPEHRDRRLVESLDLLTQALRIKNLVPSVESGDYFQQNPGKFNHEERIDAMLLSNLRLTQSQLQQQDMPDRAARALILQVIFIAYLEDRNIIGNDFYEDIFTSLGIAQLVDILGRNDPILFTQLFVELQKIFNGDIFQAPAAFEAQSPSLSIEPRHLEVLAELRQGLYDLDSSQARFWPYDFAFIPVELISAIYDRFLNEDDKARRDLGAYFTPRFLADLVVGQAWSALTEKVRTGQEFTVLDPACGSAIFLVRMFQKLVEDWKLRNDGAVPDWSTLQALLSCLHGWDTQESALRIGVFSLYVALLEQVHPPAIRALMKLGRVLPPLLGRTLCQKDFFSELSTSIDFDLIIGNPPWISRRPEATHTALEWCSRRNYPVPGGEIAWAFLWKSVKHVCPRGFIALLLPAMGILLNHSRAAHEARSKWLREVELIRVINFADICFQLFDGADRPTVLAMFRPSSCADVDYEFDYWVPKAHPLTSYTRLVTIASVDCLRMRRSSTFDDPLLWKKMMWATRRDVKLLCWLGELPLLSRIMSTFRNSRKGHSATTWVIGQGFKPYNLASENPNQDSVEEQSVTELPFLDSQAFTSWVIPRVVSGAWPTSTVHRRGFVDGFQSPHILIPQGVRRDEGLLRAAYVDQSLCFRHSLQAIRFPPGEEARAKLLTAVLNSQLAAWYFFHTSANLAADRAKVHEEQLLELPFPDPKDLPDSAAAESAQDEIVRLIDVMLMQKDEALTSSDWRRHYAERANELVFQFYGLTKEERALVEDGAMEIIPSMQPRRDQITRLMQEGSPSDYRLYMEVLVANVTRWLLPGSHVNARLLKGGSRGCIVVELKLSMRETAIQFEQQVEALDDVLGRVMRHLPVSLSRNFELQPDLKIFIDDALYFVKPRNRRQWLRGAALNDADEVIGDLLHARLRSESKNGRKEQ
jgi:hypothetical protein